VDVKIHPLVIISISDHYTRIKANLGKQVVMGCLMGIQSGRTLEIMTSFELVYERSADGISVKSELLKEREQQMKEVYPDYDILGWYTTAPNLTADDKKIHRDLCELVENQLVAVTVDCMDIDKKDHKDLPITVFEPEVCRIIVAPRTTLRFIQAVVVEGRQMLAFRPVRYRVETLEPERIAVDAVARMASAGDDSVSSQMIAHLQSMKSAIKMLNSRITVLLNFLERTNNGPAVVFSQESRRPPSPSFSLSGQLPKDHSILRAVASLCHRLPVMNTPNFEEDFLKEYNDGILVTFLTTLTNGMAATNDLVGLRGAMWDGVAWAGGWMGIGRGKEAGQSPLLKE